MRTENQWSRVPARPPAALALTLEPHGMNVSSRPSRSLTERPLQGILNNDTLPSFIRSHLLGENASSHHDRLWNVPAATPLD